MENENITVDTESKEYEQNKSVDSDNVKEESVSHFEGDSKETESVSYDQDKALDTEDNKDIDIIRFDDTGNDKAEAIIDGNRVEMSNEEAFTLALENGVDQDNLQSFAEEKGLQDDFNAAMDAKGIDTEEVATITFDPENNTATITDNGETREVSATEAFEFAIEQGEDKEKLQAFAEENGLGEDFRAAESNDFTKGIQEQTTSSEDFVQSAQNGYDEGVKEAENQIDNEKPQIDIGEDSATITQNGETREVSIQEAFEFAIEQGEDKEKLQAFAEENGLGEDFRAAESNDFTKGIQDKNSAEEDTSSIKDSANEAGNAFAEGLGDALSDAIIDSNKNSEFAFDRGMGEMFEKMDSKDEPVADQGGADR